MMNFRHASLILKALSAVGIIVLAAIAMQVNTSPIPYSPFPAQAQSSLAANVRGVVIAKESNLPIAGASIEIPSLNISTHTDSAGRFAFQGIFVDQAIYPTTIIVIASGYGDWTIEDVRLVSNDTLILTVELRDSPTTIVVPPPRAEVPSWPDELVGGSALDEPAEDQSTLPLPDTIRVRVTGYAY